MKLFSLLFLLLIFTYSWSSNETPQYELYTPTLNSGGTIINGTWTITDPCAASMMAANGQE